MKPTIEATTGFGSAILISLSDGPRPYIFVDVNEKDGNYGYIEDRDVEKLRDWCDKILKSKKRKYS